MIVAFQRCSFSVLDAKTRRRETGQDTWGMFAKAREVSPRTDDFICLLSHMQFRVIHELKTRNKNILGIKRFHDDGNSAASSVLAIYS